ncbi:hypothetical protein P8A21_37525 [Streptomyces poriferorum]|uniref:hypothetical protein n=1 Tax=Streptomyces poriferorum TaxID=2798799 RepID=UPI00273F2093|nr:hypothetical protein [Streptomyces sp. Alt1]WLQ52845.1 hypothetical protein P8A21_37525 [Streptomyces sp. Alt1]
MLTENANRDPFLTFWLRVREFAVPPSMIETATARRRAGDWAGACAAAGIDVDFQLRTLARTHGRELATRVRADLRHLVPDLLRWHLPRIAPHGLLRPGLTITLARYEAGEPDDRNPLHLVVRTPPARADAGQRMSLALWEGSRSDASARRHPHPRPSRRFRLDLHRHLWDARTTGELRIRSGADRPPADVVDPASAALIPPGRRCATGRWAAEAALLLNAETRSTGTFVVRLGGRHRLLLELDAHGDATGQPALRIVQASRDTAGSVLPVLPDAATWALPDLELIRSGAFAADRLHPLVVRALIPDHVPVRPAPAPDRAGQPRLVECRGARHRIGLVDGVLAPLDHDPAELRREELLAALTGTPMPCLQAVDEAHRRPDCLTGVRERLDHGDIEGALAVVEGLLGPGAVLRSGPLRDELETAARRRIDYGLFRADLAGSGPRHPLPEHRRSRGRHPYRRPRLATVR